MSKKIKRKVKLSMQEVQGFLINREVLVAFLPDEVAPAVVNVKVLNHKDITVDETGKTGITLHESSFPSLSSSSH